MGSWILSEVATKASELFSWVLAGSRHSPKPLGSGWSQRLPEAGFQVLWGTCLLCLYSGRVSWLSS